MLTDTANIAADRIILVIENSYGMAYIVYYKSNVISVNSPTIKLKVKKITCVETLAIYYF